MALSLRKEKCMSIESDRASQPWGGHTSSKEMDMAALQRSNGRRAWWEGKAPDLKGL